MASARSRIRTARLNSAVLIALLIVALGGAVFYFRSQGPKSVNHAPVASNISTASTDRVTPTSSSTPHPLDPVLLLADEYLQAFETNVVDYTALLTKRERVSGKLGEPETMTLKLRCPRKQPSGETSPLQVYLRFEEPKRLKGREVVWSEGRNAGKMTAHEGGWFNLARVDLDPNGTLAMMGNKYPITQIGMGTLLRKLIDKGMRDRDVGDCLVTVNETGLLNGQPCKIIEVKHPEKKTQFDFHIARIYLDTERKLPVRYEAFLWPKNPSEEPPLEEQYTYTDIRLNVGLSDADFDANNDAYEFP